MNSVTATELQRARKYRQAAIVYFGYGVLYMARILALGTRSDWNLHGYSPIVGGIFIFLGAVIAIGFPYVVWRQVRWFTIALAIAVFLRSVYLFSQANDAFFLGPFLVASVTAWMLARAAWDL